MQVQLEPPKTGLRDCGTQNDRVFSENADPRARHSEILIFIPGGTRECPFFNWLLAGFDELSEKPSSRVCVVKVTSVKTPLSSSNLLSKSGRKC